MGLNGLQLIGLSKIFKRAYHCSYSSRTSPTSLPNLRFIQYLQKNDKRKRLGAVSEDGSRLIQLSSGSCVSCDMQTFLQQNYSIQEMQTKISCLRIEKVDDTITLLPPIVNPGKIVCLGLNYADHCEEQNKPIPKEPIFFSKFNTSLVGPLGCVLAHEMVRYLDWEVELAVIIGKCARQVPIKKAMDCVFGYAVAQDITARDWQKRNGGQFLISKTMDTFCPFGPSIVHKSQIDDVYNLNMITCVNGVQKQCGNTCNMIFKIDKIIHLLSKNITLLPGDVILTGTPSGVGLYRNPRERLRPGDIVETYIENLGSLRNHIIKPKTLHGDA